MDMPSWFSAGSDNTNDSEIAQRTSYITEAAAQILGGYERAHEWIQDSNLAFGGASAPLEGFLKSGVGEQTVLNELRDKAEATHKERQDY